MESPSLARRYQALSSFISSRFSLSFQPHSLCSYLQERERKKKTPQNKLASTVPTKPTPPSHMVCMLVLVSSKAHSTARGLSAVTRLHSISRFSLERGRRKERTVSKTQGERVCVCVRALSGPMKPCVPVPVVLFKGWEGSQRVVELRGEGPELTQRGTLEPEQ